MIGKVVRSLALALWPSLLRSGPLSISLSLSRFLALLLSLLLSRFSSLALTLSRSHALTLLALTFCRSHAFSLLRSLALLLSCFLDFLLSRSRSCTLALSISLSLCHTAQEIIFAMKERRLIHGTVGKNIDWHQWKKWHNSWYWPCSFFDIKTLKEL